MFVAQDFSSQTCAIPCFEQTNARSHLLLFDSLALLVFIMAMSYLRHAKKTVGEEHDSFNVSPFHDPQNSQHGIRANQPFPVDDLSSNAGTALAQDQPMRGTAAELRQRKIRELKGSFKRALSTPPGPVQAEEPPEILGASAPPMGPAAPAASESEEPQSELLWTAERLDDLDEHVHVELTLRMQTLEWRISNIDNRVSHMLGDPTFPDQQDLKRKRYNMLSHSTPTSSPARVEPGELAPGTSAEEIAISSPAGEHAVP